MTSCPNQRQDNRVTGKHYVFPRQVTQTDKQFSDYCNGSHKGKLITQRTNWMALKQSGLPIGSRLMQPPKHCINRRHQKAKENSTSIKKHWSCPSQLPERILALSKKGIWKWFCHTMQVLGLDGWYNEKTLASSVCNINQDPCSIAAKQLRLTQSSSCHVNWHLLIPVTHRTDWNINQTM